MRRLVAFSFAVLLTTAGACATPSGSDRGPERAATENDGSGPASDSDSGGSVAEDGGGRDGRRTVETEPGSSQPNKTQSETGEPHLKATNNDVLIGSAFVDPEKTSYSFGSIPPGSSVTRTLTIGSPSSRDDGPTFESVRVLAEYGYDQAFRIEGHTCDGVRFSRGTCTVSITATPPASGQYLGVVEVDVVGGGGGSTSLTVDGANPSDPVPGSTTPGPTSSSPSAQDPSTNRPGDA
jgi:hypothetical protein